MPPVINNMVIYIYLKSFTILSIPIKKPVVSSSFAVEVHSILTPMKWQRRTLDKWKEMPQKKRTMSGVQVIVWVTESGSRCRPSRYRTIQYAMGD